MRSVSRKKISVTRVSPTVLSEFRFPWAQIPGGGRTGWWLCWMSDMAYQTTQLLLYPPLIIVCWGA